MNKKILFITGTRADYGKIKPLMKAIEFMDKFDLHVFVTGMHLLDVYGSTHTEVTKDKYNNIYIAHGMIYGNDMSSNLGNTISHIAGYINHNRPDMIVVHGDRIEALAGAVVGALNNIIVSHIEGGEVSGTIDESIRHAVSKFSHFHFVANEEAKKRIVQLGEDVEDIFVIGSPDIDIMLNDSLPTIEETKKYYGIDFGDYAIFTYHPVTTEYDALERNIKTTLAALLASGKNYVVIYPNNDFGSEIILNELSHLKGHKNFKIFPSLRFEYFLTLLKNAEFMIGNSSAGVREAGIYGVPAIDIGTRQQGRYKIDGSTHIQHVDEDVDSILSSISNINKHRKQAVSFGGGDSAGKFINILHDDRIWNKKLQKKFIDLW